MTKIYICDSSKLQVPDSFAASDYRRQRAEHSPMTSRQGLAAEYLLYMALLDSMEDPALPLDIHVTEQGKPIFVNGREFSLSHSGEFACCAVSDSPVGVDIQLEREYSEAVVHRWFSAQEREYLETAAERNAAFTRLWAARESCVKAMGGGIGRDMRAVKVYINGDIINIEGASLFVEKLGSCWIACCVPGKFDEKFILKEI